MKKTLAIILILAIIPTVCLAQGAKITLGVFEQLFNHASSLLGTNHQIEKDIITYQAGEESDIYTVSYSRDLVLQIKTGHDSNQIQSAWIIYVRDTNQSEELDQSYRSMIVELLYSTNTITLLEDVEKVITMLKDEQAANKSDKAQITYNGNIITFSPITSISYSFMVSFD